MRSRRLKLSQQIILKNPESNLFLRVKKKEELAAADGEWGGHSTIFFSVAPQDGSFFALQSSLGKFVTVDNTNVIANQQSAPSDVFSFQLVTMYNKALWDEIFKKK